MPLTSRVICARLVRESPSFLAGEILRPRGSRLYRLRESGIRVAIRHQAADSATLAEVFYHRWYDPPAEVAQAIGEPLTIVDLGANIGMFGALAVALWPASNIVAYEPDPENAQVHERTIEANGLGHRWSLVAAAAGCRDGEARFAAGLNASSHVLDGQPDATAHTITVALHDVLAALSAADVVKMDIEGGEWEILNDPRFAAQPPRVIVLEYHPAGCPGGDPRAAAERALSGAGLRTAPIWHGEDGVGMLWAWRA
jgi:FkbM family methyltransferase